MFYLKVKNLEQRTALIKYLKAKDIHTVFHYVPLHSSSAGLEFGKMVGEDRFTTKESEKLIRLPLFYKLTLEQVKEVTEAIKQFFDEQ